MVKPPIDELFMDVRERGVTLWVDGERLRARVPKGALSLALQQEIGERKEELIAFLQNARQQESSIEPVPCDRPLPLSFAQERLWFLAQLEPESTVYNGTHAIRMTGSLKIQALERSLDTLAARHDMLRVCFRNVDAPSGDLADNPIDAPARQVADPLPPVHIPLIDLSALPEDQRMDAAWQEINAIANRVFDMTQPPLWRATLIRLAGEEHIFVFVIHHIITDGWSNDIFWRELRHCYSGLINGGAPEPLPNLRISYRDFSVWQREQLQGERLQHLVDYWRTYLANLQPLNLPTDRPRPRLLNHRGGVEWFELNADLSQSLATVARASGVSLYMLLLAAFQILLHRYSGQDDIVVGTPIANRNHVELEGLFGFFLNTLIMRGDCSGNPPFRTFLERVRQDALAAYQHQGLPFERLVEELRPQRELNRNPLYDVAFTMQNMPRDTEYLAGLACERLYSTEGTNKFDLSLHLHELETKLSGHLGYSTELFDATTIQRMIGHFQTLLAAIVANPECPIKNLPMLTTAERRQLLVKWNATQTDYPREITLPQLFEDQVVETPDATALFFENEKMCYQDLDARANQLANYLLTLDIPPNSLIGLCVERSPKMVIGLLGILKAGYAYLPLDPAYPQERLRFMLQDTAAPVLVTEESLSTSLLDEGAHSTGHIIFLDKEWDTISLQSTQKPTCTISPSQPAYSLYTSGSTGRPKGVLTTHSAIVNRIVGKRRQFPLSANDRLLQKTPLSFDVSVWEIFWPLSSGAAIVLASPDGHKDPGYLVEVIRQMRVTMIYFNCSMLQVWIEMDDVTACRSLKRIFTGGEALSVALMQRTLARLDVELHNLYGPTEAAIYVSHWQCDADYPRPIVPIGRPVSGVQLYIVDEFLEPVPVGVAGELLIGGVQVADGYDNRPELTAEKFIPDHLGTQFETQGETQFGKRRDGGLLYRTGDRARWLFTDQATPLMIEFLGRFDQQVKLRGFRVEPGEIEAVLQEHPAVKDTVVLVHSTQHEAQQNKEQEHMLIAYFVPNNGPNNNRPNNGHSGGEAPTARELRHFLAQTLPGYMLPVHYIQLDALPLLPNNKLDRHALPAPHRNSNAASEHFVAPRTSIETELAKLWAKLLELERVGIHDNFFELGGHSLLTIRLVAQIQITLSITLSVADLFAAPTIAEQAQIVDARLSSEREAGDQSQLLRLIQQGNSARPPLFLVPGGGGGELEFLIYARLIHLLGTEQPVYGFFARGTDGLQSPHATIDEMVTDYLNEIRRVQPRGPYLLAGECIGGKVALELARQLNAHQEENADLLLLNAPRMNGIGQQPRSTMAGPYLNRIYHHWSELQDRTLWEWGPYLWHYWQHSRFNLLTRWQPEQQRAHRIHQARSQYTYQLRQYRPNQPYAGRIILIFSQDRATQESTREWQSLAGRGLETYPVPGSRRSYLGEHVQTTAAQLKSCLAVAQQQKSP